MGYELDNLNSVPVELLKLSSNEPLTNLFSTASDIVELGVTPEPTAWILIDIAVSTEQLDAFVGNSDCSARVVKVKGR